MAMLFGGGSFIDRLKPGWMVWSILSSNAACIYTLVRSSVDTYYGVEIL